MDPVVLWCLVNGPVTKTFEEFVPTQIGTKIFHDEHESGSVSSSDQDNVLSTDILAAKTQLNKS